MNIVQPGLLLVLCAPFVLAVRIAFTHRRRATASESTVPYQIPESVDPDPINARFEAKTVSLEAAVREAAVAMASLARVHYVRIDHAVSAAMTVHVAPSALGMALRETLLTAIRGAPGGQVLVTAVTLGTQLHIRVTDDGPGADQQGRELLARRAAALIALQGGSIMVETSPGRGTTVSIRLPLPGKAGGEITSFKRLPVLADQAA